MLPFSSIILWWPKFYAAILLDPDGRSLFQILSDPGFSEGVERDKECDKYCRRLQPSQPLRRVRRQFLAKQKRALSVAHSNVHSTSSYTSHGAYAHLGKSQDPSAGRAIFLASRTVYCNNPFGMNRLFNYVAERIPDLPDTVVTHGLAIMMISLAFAWTLGGRLLVLIIKDFNEEHQHLLDGTLLEREQQEPYDSGDHKNMLSRTYAALATGNDSTSSTTLFDTDGISFVIDNSASCIVCNDRSQFIGALREKSYSVQTANGTSSSSWVGTLRLTLTDDAGKSFRYQIPDVIYDPSSPFNILGVPMLGDFFGRNDPIPSSDDTGTFVASSANKSVLTWDHGKHSRSFSHSDKRLPELVCESGYGYFNAFATRLSRSFNDKVQYAFSSAYSQMEDLTPTRPSVGAPANPVTPDTPFPLGEELVYTDGAGSSEAVVYEGPSVDGNHIIRTEDGSRVVTSAPHLKLFDQPDLTDVPRTPLDYCKEMKDITAEDLKSLVYPKQLSPVQQEFLSWHNRLFHMPFSRMFKLAKLGILPKRFLKCTDVLCISCQFGKAHRRPWRTRAGKSNGIRKRNEKKPGDGTSMDQIVSAQPGLVPQMSGPLGPDRIWGATIFVDHVTDYVFCHLMKALTLDETLAAKTAYEKCLAQMGHKAKHFRADNGRFADTRFMKSIQDSDQTIDFCAVGHHGQNGIVEHKNKMITLGARTLLLHGIRMWPQMIDSMFWPFALKSYVELMNCLHVDDKGQTPESKITGVPVHDLPVGNYHTLFCPVYVLDARLQSAGGLGPPKWEPRSRIGVYCGHSPLHAGNVALVFNPRTGRVSPQFHCVFDDEFTTVPYMEKGEVPPNWEDLCRNSYESAEDDAVAAAIQYLSSQTGAEQAQTSVTAQSLGATSDAVGTLAAEDPLSDPFAVSFDQQPHDNSNPRSTNSCPVSEGVDLPRRVEQQDAAALEPALKRQRKQTDDNTGQPINLMTDFDACCDADEEQQNQLLMPKRVNLYEAGLRRSKRIQEKNANQAKAHVTFGKKKVALTLFALITSVCDTKLPSRPLPENPTRWNRIVNRFEEINEHCDGTLNEIHHLVLATDASNETYTYSQAMKQDDRNSFVKAMEKEIEDHEKRNHWKLVHRSTIPSGTKRIKAIWSFKRKRYPDGSLNKHKARICCHGGQQEYGVNYWETYSPVVNALTVKLLLVVANLHGLSSKSIDFVLAFPQAEVDAEIYMDLPIGFEPEFGHPSDYSLLLLRNLYGLKQGSHNWYQKLKGGLTVRGFDPSKIDPCLYLRKGMIVLTYVDDCIIVGNSIKEIDEFIKSLQGGSEDFILTDEGNIDKFLGVEIVDRGRGEFEMKQPYLIDRILEKLGLKDNSFECYVNERKTPANTVLLNRDLDGKPRKKKWNYRQVVGMLGYLQANSRPDISMPTHQCARFCIDPKLSHEQAITRIGRYLRDTSTRGIIYKPDKTKGLEVFVDADFAGGWNKNDPTDVDTLYSRAGYVIKYAGCPVYWKSKLMNSELALSTAEAEFMALSIALREVIPLMSQMEEIHKVFPLHIDKPNFHCKVWEDNQSCIAMTRRHHFTPRTKHIALKYYHFMSYVGTRIRINYIHTESQEADIFTKPVKDHLFFPLRAKLMGW